MRFSAGRFLVGAALLVSSAGCVDKQYDLGRLDPEITVMKTGLGYPLGYTMKQSLGELLELDLYTSIKTEENGDYYLSAHPDPFQVSVRIPEGGDLTSQFEPFTFSVGPFPQSVLRNHPDARPDYSGSRLILGLDSGIPASLLAGISFETRIEGGQEQAFSYDNLPVVPGKSEVTIQDEKLFNPIPNNVRVSALRVSAEPSQLALLEHGKTYSVTIAPLLKTPLAFAAGSEFHFRISLGLLFGLIEQISKEIHVREVILRMTVTNSIPLELSAEGHFEDYDGNRLDDIEVNVSGPVAGGTPDSPSVTSLAISLASKSRKLATDKFILDLTGRTTEKDAGIRFNRNQSIQIKDIRAFLPYGVQIDLFKDPADE